MVKCSLKKVRSFFIPNILSPKRLFFVLQQKMIRDRDVTSSTVFGCRLPSADAIVQNRGHRLRNLKEPLKAEQTNPAVTRRTARCLPGSNRAEPGRTWQNLAERAGTQPHKHHAVQTANLTGGCTVDEWNWLFNTF